MSANLPPEPSGTSLPPDAWYGWRPVPKFQHRYWKHIVLFALTFLTTTFVGGMDYAGFGTAIGLAHAEPTTVWSATFWLHGLWYSLPVLAILGAHEFGHYALCRVHNVDATLPYFIPAPPIFIAGTFGAVIRIREAFPSKRALFDIGIAGPIAGFLALLPVLYWGVSLSAILPVAPNAAHMELGEPLLFQAAARLALGTLPAGYDIWIHPMAMAAWWGLLATALNLLPFGQLDGGHVVYAVTKRRNHAAIISILTMVAAGALTIRSLSWVSMLVIMIVMAAVFGLHHPRVIDEDVPLGTGRRILALVALIIFVLCFTPVPIQLFLGE